MVLTATQPRRATRRPRYRAGVEPDSRTAAIAELTRLLDDRASDLYDAFLSDQAMGGADHAAKRLVDLMTGGGLEDEALAAARLVTRLAEPHETWMPPGNAPNGWYDTALGRVVLTARLSGEGGSCSQRDAARVLGLSPSAVQKAVKTGRLATTADGSVDVESLLGVLAERA